MAPIDPGTLCVLPLTPERMADLDALFARRGCAVARECGCMYYRRRGGQAGPPAHACTPAANRAALAELATSDQPPGLLGYLDGTPAGWVSLGPREDYLRLENSRTMRRVDAQPVWSVICFVVPSAQRRQGVAHALLAAGITHARERGAQWLEAYPVDRAVPGASEAPWFGSLTMFQAAGFAEVARRTPARPVVRLAL